MERLGRAIAYTLAVLGPWGLLLYIPALQTHLTTLLAWALFFLLLIHSVRSGRLGIPFELIWPAALIAFFSIISVFQNLPGAGWWVATMATFCATIHFQPNDETMRRNTSRFAALSLAVLWLCVLFSKTVAGHLYGFWLASDALSFYVQISPLHRIMFLLALWLIARVASKILLMPRNQGASEVYTLAILLGFAIAFYIWKPYALSPALGATLALLVPRFGPPTSAQEVEPRWSRNTWVACSVAALALVPMNLTHVFLENKADPRNYVAQVQREDYREKFILEQVLERYPQESHALLLLAGLDSDLDRYKQARYTQDVPRQILPPTETDFKRIRDKFRDTQFDRFSDISFLSHHYLLALLADGEKDLAMSMLEQYSAAGSYISAPAEAQYLSPPPALLAEAISQYLAWPELNDTLISWQTPRLLYLLRIMGATFTYVDQGAMAPYRGIVCVRTTASFTILAQEPDLTIPRCAIFSQLEERAPTLKNPEAFPFWTLAASIENGVVLEGYPQGGLRIPLATEAPYSGDPATGYLGHLTPEGLGVFEVILPAENLGEPIELLPYVEFDKTLWSTTTP